MEPFERKRVATRLAAVPAGETAAVEVLTSVVSPNVVTSPLSGLRCALLCIELLERIPLEQGGTRAPGDHGSPGDDFVSLGQVTFGQILVLRDVDGDEISLVAGRLRFDVAAPPTGGAPLSHVPAELVPLLRHASGRGVVCHREFPLVQGDKVRLRAVVEPTRAATGGARAESRRSYVARDDLGLVVLAAAFDAPVL